ncbi:UNKNOWN [Stylonychia lemnae]|uniref:Transmembrane protein n=1 Tax=Stylonychia lemnae TaxID=5949 RepID=A0A078A425_STYLE|nr:UNKNOWN [Stylonychia lemnae]|eukprot:CDW76887.1 UNKNOWN [Stylonychia lemnae]
MKKRILEIQESERLSDKSRIQSEDHNLVDQSRYIAHLLQQNGIITDNTAISSSQYLEERKLEIIPQAQSMHEFDDSELTYDEYLRQFLSNHESEEKQIAQGDVQQPQKGKKREKIKNLMKGMASFITQNTLKPLSSVIQTVQNNNLFEDSFEDNRDGDYTYDNQNRSEQIDDSQKRNEEYGFEDETKAELDEMIRKTCQKIEEAQKQERNKTSSMNKSEVMRKYYYDLRNQIVSEKEQEKKKNTNNYGKQMEMEQEDYVQEKQEIENDMLRMAQGMKQFANSFKSQFQKDEVVLKKIADSQEQNLDKTEKERDEIAKLQAKVFSSFWQRILMLIIATLTFMGTGFFIWLFPNKIKYEVAGAI